MDQPAAPDEDYWRTYCWACRGPHEERHCTRCGTPLESDPNGKHGVLGYWILDSPQLSHLSHRDEQDWNASFCAVCAVRVRLEQYPDGPLRVEIGHPDENRDSEPEDNLPIRMFERYLDGRASTGRSYRSGWGDQRKAVRAVINGQNWHGVETRFITVLRRSTRKPPLSATEWLAGEIRHRIRNRAR